MQQPGTIVLQSPVWHVSLQEMYAETEPLRKTQLTYLLV